MYSTVYGIVASSGDSHKHVVLVGAKNIPFDVKGKLLRFGRFEAALAKFPVGTWVQAHLLVTEKGSFKFAFKNQGFSILNRKEFFMSGNFVVLLAVNSQVVNGVSALSAVLNLPQSVLKSAWFTVADTGKSFVFETPFSLEDGKRAVDAISNTLALAALVDENGKTVYMPASKVLGTGQIKKAVKKAAVPAAVPAAVAQPATPSNYFYVEDDANIVLSAVANGYNRGFDGAVNILVTGDSGTGKTSLAKRFADKMGWDCHRLNCALITEAGDIAGQRGIKNGETVWEWSAVATAISNGNCVIILDELNRSYPNAMNALLGLLDDARRTWFNDLELVVGKNVVFFATINEGAQYTGTFQADAALLNRFQYIFRMGNVPTNQQKLILASNFPSLSDDDLTKILRVSNAITLKIQDLKCPIRTLKSVASAIVAGMSHREAWEFTFVTALHDSIKREVIDLLNSSFGPYVPEESSVKLIF